MLLSAWLFMLRPISHLLASPALDLPCRITMSLLGPSLHTLNQKHRPSVVPQLGGYARGMLAALEGLHRQGVSGRRGRCHSG